MAIGRREFSGCLESPPPLGLMNLPPLGLMTLLWGRCPRAGARGLSNDAALRLRWDADDHPASRRPSAPRRRIAKTHNRGGSRDADPAPNAPCCGYGLPRAPGAPKLDPASLSTLEGVAESKRRCHDRAASPAPTPTGSYSTAHDRAA